LIVAVVVSRRVRSCFFNVVLTLFIALFPAHLFAQNPGELKWRVRPPDRAPISAGPALGTNGLIYGATYLDLYAWDAATGALRWSTNVDGRAFDSSAALAIGPEGHVYVSTTTGLRAFEGNTGARLWSSDLRGVVSIGADGTVYVASSPVKALDPATGGVRWSSTSINGEELVPVALSASSLAYVASAPGIAAVDMRTGGHAWSFGNQGWGFAYVIVAGDGTVLAVQATGHLTALDGFTGKRLWQRQGERTLTDLIIAPDGSICVAHDEAIYVRDPANGDVQRRLLLKNCERPRLAFAQDNTLYVATYNYSTNKALLLALDFETGATNWISETTEGGRLNVGSDGTIYTASGYENLYAIHGASPLANSAWPKAQQNAQNTSYWKVSGPPAITKQPQSQWAASDGSARFHVYTPVTRPVEFQWYFNGQPIVGANSDSYVVVSVQFSSAGRYSVMLSNEFGRVVSDEATLSVGYGLETTAVGPGTIRRMPDLEVYPTNSIVELTAVPGRSNHAFVRWSGDATGNAPRLTITLDRNYAITGEFTHIFPDMKWTNDFGHAPALGTNGYLYAFSGGYITAIDTRDGATVFYDHYFDSWWAPGALGRDGTLYIGNYSGSSVWAHDGITGEQKGGYTVDVCVHACPAIGVDGTLYLSGRHLYAADPGVYRKHKWVFQAGNIFESSPAVGANGLVYAGCMDGKMYAVDSVTGVKRWEFVTGDAVYSSPALAADGTVYFGSYDGNVYALNGETGEKRWEFATDGTVPASPIIGPDGTVYIGSMDNKVYALNGATGAKRWEFLAGAGIPFTAALTVDGTLYVGSYDGWLYVLNSQTGEKVWQLPGASTPTIGPDGTIYSGGYAIYGTSPLAESSWPKFHATLDNRGRLPGRPVIDSRESRFTPEGLVLAVHAETGDRLDVEWSMNLRDWQHLATATNTAGRVEVLDATATASGQRFYRARLQR